MPPPEYRPPVVPAWSLLGVVAGAWAAGLGFGVGFGGTLAGVAQDLSLPTVQAGLVLVVPFVVATLVATPLGWLVGRRWPNAVTVAGMVFVAVGLVVAAFAPSAPVIGLGRALAGAGSGAALGALGAVLGRITSGRTATVVVSVLGIVVAGVIGWLVSTVVPGFRTAFLAAILPTIPVGVTATVVGFVNLVRRR